MWEAGVSLVPFSFRQPPTSSWHKISWTNCLFFCFVVVRSLRKRTSSNICMFFPVSSIKKRSFNLLCVLDLNVSQLIELAKNFLIHWTCSHSLEKRMSVCRQTKQEYFQTKKRPFAKICSNVWFTVMIRNKIEHNHRHMERKDTSCRETPGTNTRNGQVHLEHSWTLWNEMA